MSKNTTGKIVLFGIAFIVSCMIWYVVITGNDPRVNISLGSMEVELTNLESIHKAGFACYIDGDSSSSVVVNVVQERGWLVGPEDIRLVADLSGFTGKESSALISAEVINNQSTIGKQYRLSQSHVNLRMEKLVDKVIPFRVSVRGNAADSLTYGTPVAEQQNIKVKVPESMYDQVVSAEGYVDVKNHNESFTANAAVQVVDSENQVIDCHAEQILLEKEQVSVFVPVGLSKNVKISCELETGSENESGYRCMSTAFNKKSIDLIYPADTSAFPEKIVISKKDLSIEGREETFTQNINLSGYLAEGIYPVDQKDLQIEAEVTLEKVTHKRYIIPVSDIKVLNQPSACAAVFNQDKLTVSVRGTESVLAALQAKDIQVELDLNGYREGRHNITVNAEITNRDLQKQCEIISADRAAVTLTEN